MRPSLAVAAALLLPWVARVSVAQGLPEVEPNDGPATATTHALGAQSYGSLTAGDADWFRIFLAQPSDLRCWTAPGFLSQAGNTRLGLFDHAGQLRFEVDDGNLTTHGRYSLLEGPALPAGTYYLRVRGFDGAVTGSYTLDAAVFAAGILLHNPGSVVSVVEAAEQNDPRRPGGVATVSAVTTRNTGNIAVGAGSTSYTGAVADYDFYTITVPANGLLTLATSAGAAPAASDTVIHLCDAALLRLAFDDDSGPGFYSVLRYQIPTAGVYHAVVSDYGVGNYTLDVTFEPPLPTGEASVSIVAGGCGPWFGVPALGTRWTNTAPLVRIEEPVLGTTFYLDLITNIPSSTLVVRLTGTLPRVPALELTSLGAPGCRVEVDALGVEFVASDASGVHFWGLVMAANVTLLGLPLEQQAVVLDPLSNALGIRMSNRVTSRAGISH